MEALKKEAINVISKMPDTAEIDDIMYRLCVIDKVRKGREPLDRVIPCLLRNYKRKLNHGKMVCPCQKGSEAL